MNLSRLHRLHVTRFSATSIVNIPCLLMLINVLTFDIQCTPIYAQQTFYMNNERMLNL